ncbi:uncharacterized protein [Dysidea avara]|uniref:uncharacterized protein isoform X2 n=1 Tax=Dysidea avara TaxID=196820 RepID=UPI00332DC5CE
MVDFISAFCTVLPIVIVSVLLALTWSSFNGRRAGLRPLARSGRGAGKKSRRFRQHTKAEWEDNKLYKAEMLILPKKQTNEEASAANSSTELSVLARKLHKPCLVCREQEAKRNCRYERCAVCCRMDKDSVCRAHGTGYESAMAQIELALTHQLYCVDISYAQIQQCPPRLIKLGSTPHSLNLSNNCLKSLPDELGNLSNLVELFLQYNHLQYLPDSLCKITTLEELDVKNNKLTLLPVNIGQLQNLVVLTLTNNQLTEVPSSIGDLTNLEELSLHSNCLMELPKELCKLTQLQVLYAGENKLKCLPDNIGRMSGLSEFDISNCELTRLPESLSNCTSLTKLRVSHNQLSRLPARIGSLKELKELHMRKNQLKYFPFSISELDIYTINSLYNPLLEDTDIEIIKNLIKSPKELVPTLVELAGRMVAKYNIQRKPGDLPRRLEVMLCNGEWCTSCGGPIFFHYKSEITFGCVGIFRVPLYSITCSPQCHI